ncbi:MAG: lamin tail domain-containing protein [Candidatus Gracilibacteria bacterium]|jgi:hypothetical protein
MKKKISVMLLCALILPTIQMRSAFAASTLDVVINEIAWAGSVDSSSDEWIELKNNTATAIDLSGWSILDDGTGTYNLSGTIPANGYFLIESNENAVSTISADLIVSLSLANTGDSLVLRDAAGITIDTANGTGGAWQAGSNTTKATMERIDSEVSGDSNWGSCASGNGNQSSAGTDILGTPKGLNSVSTSSSGTGVSLTVSDSSPQVGNTIEVSATVSDVEDLFSYGFDVEYDASVLDFQSASKGSFLSQSDSVQTSFNAELQDDTEGVLVLGEARTQTEKTGISGDGTLFTIEFLVIGGSGSSDITLNTSRSFIADLTSDIEMNMEDTSITVLSGAEQVSDVQVSEGTERYSLALSWTAPSEGADSYRILRLNQEGDYEEIGTASGTTYTDNHNMIPNNTYTYQVITIKGISESAAVSATGMDTRGIKGDNNRSDRVDGRDLEALAQHYGETYADTDYEELIDTTYDGSINGSDLIDIGINWAITY